MIFETFVSIFFSILILLIHKFLFKIGIDEQQGIQKIHRKSATRIGGISIFATGILVGFFFRDSYLQYSIVFLCIFLIFIIGLIEDITRKLSPTIRLVLTIFVCSILVFMTETRLDDVDLKFINFLLSQPLVAFFISALGISITSNAWNFIDGLNGLSSGTAFIVLISFSIIADQYNIIFLSNVLFSVAFIILGFLIVNLFTGQIFFGDGGSYAVGAFIAWSGIELVNQNNSILAWSIFLIIIYPATEFSFSFLRRIFTRKSPFVADNLHLHSLLYSYINELKLIGNTTFLNSVCGSFLVLFASVPALIALIIGNNLNFIFITLVFFIMTYVCFYVFLLKKINKNN